MQNFYELTVKTQGQGLYDFTKETIDWVKKQKVNNGILNLSILHTSASLTNDSFITRFSHSLTYVYS